MLIGSAPWTDISTHTPLARRDQDGLALGSLIIISTHTPLARRDQDHSDRRAVEGQFLLTRLLRGATRRERT